MLTEMEKKRKGNFDKFDEKDSRKCSIKYFPIGKFPPVRENIIRKTSEKSFEDYILLNINIKRVFKS